MTIILLYDIYVSINHENTMFSWQCPGSQYRDIKHMYIVQCNVHFTMYTIYNIHCTMYIVYSTINIMQIVQCTQCAFSNAYNMLHRTMYIVQCTCIIVYCILQRILSIQLYNIFDKEYYQYNSIFYKVYYQCNSIFYKEYYLYNCI